VLAVDPGLAQIKHRYATQIQLKLTTALRYSNMKLNSGNKNEQGRNKSICCENIVLFI
jgi:hypothetical protein